MKGEDSGDIITQIGFTIVTTLKKNTILVINSLDNKNFIKYFKNGKLVYEWTDYLKGDNSLIREIGKTTILWKDNEII